MNYETSQFVPIANFELSEKASIEVKGNPYPVH